MRNDSPPSKQCHGRSFQNVADWARQGPYRPHLVTHRRAGTIELIRMQQPAGHYPDPPIHSFTVFYLFDGEGQLETDFGDGRRNSTLGTGIIGVTPSDNHAVNGDHGQRPLPALLPNLKFFRHFSVNTARTTPIRVQHEDMIKIV